MCRLDHNGFNDYQLEVQYDETTEIKERTVTVKIEVQGSVQENKYAVDTEITITTIHQIELADLSIEGAPNPYLLTFVNEVEMEISESIMMRFDDNYGDFLAIKWENLVTSGASKLITDKGPYQIASY